MAIKDIFNNYYNGKPGKADFTENDLPTNRLQLFRQVLQVRKGNMVSLNFLYMLIWIPAAAWTVMNYIRFLGVEPEQYPGFIFMYLFILFPLIAITGPFTAGISYVMRNWARDEHSYPFSDFVQGMRDNWKQALLLSTINGALPVIAYLGIYFYAGMAHTSMAYYVLIGILVLAVLLWLLAVQATPTMMVTYDLPFGTLIKNSVLMALAALPKAAGVKLITLIFPIATIALALFVPGCMNWWGSAVIVIYGTFMLSFNKLLQASYANYVCERYLNPKIDGAPVNIGLRME